MRTKEEIEQAIERLLKNKELCSRYNFFGEDNHKSIDIKISVLEKHDLTPTEIEDYVYTFYDWKFTNAMSALEYMRGEWKLKDILYPEKL